MGIEVVALQGKVVKPIVECAWDGMPSGGGRNSRLTTLWGYTLKLNPAIDNTCQQPSKELKVIHEALELH